MFLGAISENEGGEPVMANMTSLIRKYGGGICRECINREYGAKLTPKDCIYYDYPYTCFCCQQHRNIVKKFRPSGQMKMLIR